MRVLLGFAEVNYHRIFEGYGDFQHLMPPLSLYVLAACLRRAGHEVDLLDPAEMGLDGPRAADLIPLDYDDRDFLTAEAVARINRLLREGEFTSLRERARAADLVGISANTFGWPTARKMIEEVRAANPDVPIVLGGPHPTYVPDHVIRSTRVDFVIRGEGERALPALADALDGRGTLEAIAGLTRWRRGEVVHNLPPEPLPIAFLEECPLPAFDLLPEGVYPTINLETSRGCKFACKFCSIPFQMNWRGLGVEAVERRIDHALSFAGRLRPGSPDYAGGGLRAGKTILNFVDDTFTMDVRRGAEILARVAARDLEARGMELSYEARATEFTDPRISDLLARIPLQMLLIGADCGYDEGLKRVGKGLTTRSIREAARVSAEKGFISGLVYAFIIGYPWETRAEVMRTLDFAWELTRTYGANTNINWLLCLPGSYFWNHRRELGFQVEPEDYDEVACGTFQLLSKTAVRLSDDDIVAIGDYHRNYEALRLVTGAASGFTLRHAS